MTNTSIFYKEVTIKTSIIEAIICFIWGIFFTLFPLFILTITIDHFILPKEILLVITLVLTLLFWGASMIQRRKTIIRRTAFDLPIILLLLSIGLSTFFAINRFDSLISSFPFLFLVLGFFLLVNTIKENKSFLFLLFSMNLGACILSIITIANFFRIYLIPFSLTHTSSFTPFGSLLDQSLFLLGNLSLAFYLTYPFLKKKINKQTIIYAIAFIILAIGLFITIFKLITTEKPLLLPYQIGFQTAMASISQDNTRAVQSFLFGSGFGTYNTVFSKFKQATFNQNNNIWFLSFGESSSFALELLATTGVLGFFSFLFLLYRIFTNITVQKNPLFIILFLLSIASFLLPFTFISLGFIIFSISLAAISEGIRKNPAFFDAEVEFFTFREDGFNTLVKDEPTPESKNKITPILFFLFSLIFSGFLIFYTIYYSLSEIIFQKALISASNNNGSQTYQLQKEAINMFPYRDAYYRIFSQTNIALANSIASSQKKGSSLSSNSQKLMTELIQQSIVSAKNATVISPETAVNWTNLANIYRSLIGFGQNAENFSISSMQKAISLDPTNPQAYITLGSIYYQLSHYDDAIPFFKTAISLKKDFANAYYNLGHAYEAKGDLELALKQYKVVKELVHNKSSDIQSINLEIEVIQEKIQKNKNVKAGTTTKTLEKLSNTDVQKSLNLNQSQSKIPNQNP